MKYYLSLIAIYSILCFNSMAQDNCKPTINYGNNSKVGAIAEVNGLKMYYEAYGNLNNPQLLLIHGNGGDICSWNCQIDHFKNNYRIIVADSRAHGKSENGNKELTYELMAQDYFYLLNYL